MDLKIYSQNCCGLPFTYKSRRFNNILRNIVSNDFDVVFLQEVFFKRDLELFTSSLEHLYYIVYSQCKYTVSGGLVMLIKKDLLDSREYDASFVKFDEQANLLSLQLPDRCMGKGYLYTYIKDLDMYFINVHCFASYLLPRLQKRVIKQLMEIHSFVSTKRCLLGGDFNVSLDNEVLESYKYVNLTPGLVSYPFLNKQLDYILGSNINDIEMKSSVSVRTGSDHLGLVSDLKLGAV